MECEGIKVTNHKIINYIHCPRCGKLVYCTYEGVDVMERVFTDGDACITLDFNIQTSEHVCIDDEGLSIDITISR